MENNEQLNETLTINPIIRQQIANGVHLTAITDPRYKQNSITINFLTPLSAKTVSNNATAVSIIAKTSKTYPKMEALSNKLSSLYAASLSETVGKLGDSQFVGLGVMGLDNAFALEGEDILSEITDILLDCLLNPCLENGMFKADIVEIERKVLIDNILSSLNDKMTYILNKSKEVLYEGEPAAINTCGSVSMAQAVTAETATVAYRSLIETAPIEIVCVGRSDFVEIKSKLSDTFNKLKSNRRDFPFSTKSTAKPTPLTVTENLFVTQSKMVIAFKSAYKNEAAIKMLSKLYGGTTSSKLFLNVREKLSLCYYCQSLYSEIKGALIVDCGVESCNIEEAKKEILYQFSELKNGNFTDLDIENAKSTAINDYRSISDNIGSMYRYYFTNIYKGTIRPPEEALQEEINVTRQDIIEAANSFTLDTIYILTGKEDETDE